MSTRDCAATIELPGYHRFLNCDYHVHVSGRDHFGAGHARVSDDQSRIDVTSDADGRYDVFVLATRKDVHAQGFWKGAERVENNEPETTFIMNQYKNNKSC